MGTEATISSDAVFNGRLIRLRVDQASLSNGRTVQREVVEHPGAVAMVALDAQGDVLLVRQFRYPVGQELLEIPAGTVKEGEDPAETAQRELAEETGFSAGRLDLLLGYYPSPGVLTEYLWVYLARDLAVADGEPEEDEDLQLVRMPFEKALELVKQGEIKDSKSIIGLLTARDRLREEPVWTETQSTGTGGREPCDRISP